MPLILNTPVRGLPLPLVSAVLCVAIAKFIQEASPSYVILIIRCVRLHLSGRYACFRRVVVGFGLLITRSPRQGLSPSP